MSVSFFFSSPPPNPPLPPTPATTTALLHHLVFDSPCLGAHQDWPPLMEATERTWNWEASTFSPLYQVSTWNLFSSSYYLFCYWMWQKDKKAKVQAKLGCTCPQKCPPNQAPALQPALNTEGYVSFERTDIHLFCLQFLQSSYTNCQPLDSACYMQSMLRISFGVFIGFVQVKPHLQFFA